MPKAKLIDKKALMGILSKKRGAKALKEFAPEIGVSFQFLSCVFADKRNPGAQILHHLGYEAVTMYRRTPRTRKPKETENV